MDVAYLYLLQFWGELSPPQPLSHPLAGGDKACPVGPEDPTGVVK